MNKKFSFSWSEILFYAILLIVILVFPYFYCFANVSGESMYPTLKDKDYLFVSKTAKIDYGDIVIIKKDNSDRYLVKRVIALPNDEIELSSDGVSINGTILNETYINTYEETDYNNYSETVGADSYYVLGDNRNHSSDSRVFGDVKASEIKGVVKFNLTSIGISHNRMRVIFIILAVCLILYKPRRNKRDLDDKST